eukprot:GHUV01010886.1.p1 GENE.GHUV01010886.1~~GHUV01010886.1.p1  ORF type:complete len:269 (+),score=58.42 GHUV01010886.1:105-911(+)
MVTAQLAVRSLEREECVYTSCYCEENVYKLLQSLIRSGVAADCLFAVFISNSNETIPLWEQKASKQEDGLVVWDYHMIVLEVRQQQPSVFVWDLDAQLSFPCSLQRYVEHALKADQVVLAPKYERWYRIVAAQAFLDNFACNRSHMKAADGSWLQPPPLYPCIVAADGCTDNLRHYRDMHTDRLQLCQPQVFGPNYSMQNDEHAAVANLHAAAIQSVGLVPDSMTDVIDADHQESVPAWSNIVEFAKRKYGVVMSEAQLLGSLLVSVV